MDMTIDVNYVLFALIGLNLVTLGVFLVLEMKALRIKFRRTAKSSGAGTGPARKKTSRRGNQLEKALLDQTSAMNQEDRVELGDLGSLLSATGGLDQHGKPLPGPAQSGRRFGRPGLGNLHA